MGEFRALFCPIERDVVKKCGEVHTGPLMPLDDCLCDLGCQERTWKDESNVTSVQARDSGDGLMVPILPCLNQSNPFLSPLNSFDQRRHRSPRIVSGGSRVNNQPNLTTATLKSGWNRK